MRARSTQWWRTPLTLAISYTKCQLFRELLALGVDPNEPQESGVRPYQYAIEQGRLDVAEIIKNAGGY